MPELLYGFTEKVITGCGNLYVTLDFPDENYLERGEIPCRISAHLEKAGGCASPMIEAIGNVTGLCLQSGVEPKYIVSNLRGIRCSSIAWEKSKAILSCADGIGKVLEKYISKL